MQTDLIAVGVTRKAVETTPDQAIRDIITALKALTRNRNRATVRIVKTEIIQ